MSKAGRLQEAFYEILEGFEINAAGDYQEGPMYRHPQLRDTIRKLVDAAFNILQP